MEDIKLANKSILIAVLLVLFIINYIPIKSAQVPQQPSDFYGTITIDGSPAPAGTIISPRISGNPVPNDFTVTTS